MGGALLVAAGLLKAGGEREDVGVGGKAVERGAQPNLGLGHVFSRDRGPDGSLKIARASLIHGDGFVERECVLRAADASIGTGKGETNVEAGWVGLGSGFKNPRAARELAGGKILIGAADGPVGPEGLHLLALIGGEIGARVKSGEDGIERGVAVEVVEQPGVLDLKRSRDGGAVKKIESFDAMDVGVGVRLIADGNVEAGDGLHPLDVGFEKAARFGGDFIELAESLGVAISGHERKDEALPRVGGERVRRIESGIGWGGKIGGLNGGERRKIAANGSAPETDAGSEGEGGEHEMRGACD